MISYKCSQCGIEIMYDHYGIQDESKNNIREVVCFDCFKKFAEQNES